MMDRRLGAGIREDFIGNPAQKHSTGAWDNTTMRQRGRGPNPALGPRRRNTTAQLGGRNRRTQAGGRKRRRL